MNKNGDESVRDIVLWDVYLACHIVSVGGITVIGACACACQRYKQLAPSAFRLFAKSRYCSNTLQVDRYKGSWAALVQDDNSLNGLRVSRRITHCNWYQNSALVFYQARVVASALRCRCHDNTSCELVLLVDARGEADLRSAATSRVRRSADTLRQAHSRAMSAQEILDTSGFDPSTILSRSYCGWTSPGRHLGALTLRCGDSCKTTCTAPTTYFFNYNGQPDYADVPILKLRPGESLRTYFTTCGTFEARPIWTQPNVLTPRALLEAAPDDTWLRPPPHIPLPPRPVLNRLCHGLWGAGLYSHHHHDPSVDDRSMLNFAIPS